nr:hypothetical protein [Tanacetum cinerariifolium]
MSVLDNNECLDDGIQMGKGPIKGRVGFDNNRNKDDISMNEASKTSDAVEDLIEIGSKKWELTLCGHLVGHYMSLPALNYHLRRMWCRIGFKQIMDNGNGRWLFKFNNEQGMNSVVEQSPWMVPMEAWSTEGISAISSSIGRPIVMDNMTAYVCKNGTGKTEYARVLVEVEVEASKGFKEEVVLQYRDKNQNVKGTNMVKIAYDWKPPLCYHCGVFGHDFKSCKKRTSKNNDKPSTSYTQTKQQWAKKTVEGDERKMIQYFKRSWNTDREKEKNDILNSMEGIVEDVLDDESMATSEMAADELNALNLQKCVRGCLVNGIGYLTLAKAMVAVGELLVGIMMLLNFIYAANTGMERRTLWGDLDMAKIITKGCPWIIMGDFNVTLKLDEHSVGKIMANEVFIAKYNQAYAIFHPFMVSDHSPVVFTMPKEMIKKRKPFKFANYIADKGDF